MHPTEDAAGKKVEIEMHYNREMADIQRDLEAATLEVKMRYQHLCQEATKNEEKAVALAEQRDREHTARAEYIRAGELEDVGDPLRIPEADRKHMKRVQEDAEHKEYLDREQKRRDQMK